MSLRIAKHTAFGFFSIEIEIGIVERACGTLLQQPLAKAKVSFGTDET